MTRLLFILVLKSLLIHEKIRFVHAEPIITNHTVTAEPEEFPFVVSVGWKKTDNMREEETHLCGGALITKKHVLTAAHCKNNVDDINKVRVKIGSNDLHRSKEYAMDAWDTYDEWFFRNNEIHKCVGGNDVSVITLSKTAKIKPAYISDLENDVWIGKTVVTAGWGFKKNDERPRLMEKAFLNVSSRAECERKIAETNCLDEEVRVPMGYLCTNAGPYVVLGYGDSGSPLIVNQRTIIAINRSSCPFESRIPFGEQNIHVGVHDYMDFINNVTESTKSTTSCFPSRIYRVSTPPRDEFQF